jgi:hypothetical protein
VFVSTIYDIYTKKLSSSRNEKLLVFSLNDNFEQLMKINDSSSVISCIDGLKAISGDLIAAKQPSLTQILSTAYWVITFHRHYLLKPKNLLGQIFHEFRINGQLAVDTFIACSGILVSMSLLKSFER